MGSKFSIFENKSKVEIEIRVFVPPSRPDRYKKIIRVKPGETKLLRTKKLFCQATNLNLDEYPISLMVFLDNIYSGTTIYIQDIEKYAKILGYVDNMVVSISKASESSSLASAYSGETGVTDHTSALVSK